MIILELQHSYHTIFLLSLFPLLIFLVSLFPYLPITQENVLGLVEDFAPQESMKLIETTFHNCQRKTVQSCPLVLLGTLWSASNGINAIIKAMNHAYEVQEGRSFLRTRLTAVLLTLAMIVVIAVALLLPVFGKAYRIVSFFKARIIIAISFCLECPALVSEFVDYLYYFYRSLLART